MADRTLEFADRMNALLVEFADVVAPTRCSVCGDEEPCPHPPGGITAVAIPDVALSEWVLIHSWSSFAKAGGYWDWAASPTMTMTGVLGLLVAAQRDAERNL